MFIHSMLKDSGGPEGWPSLRWQLGVPGASPGSSGPGEGEDELMEGVEDSQRSLCAGGCCGDSVPSLAASRALAGTAAAWPGFGVWCIPKSRSSLSSGHSRKFQLSKATFLQKSSEDTALGRFKD